jgi:hypothetical protein
LPTWQHGLAPGRSGLVADSTPWPQSGGSLVAVWSSSWEAAPDCLPDCLPDCFPDTSLGQLLGSCSRLLQTPIPGTCSWRVSGAHFSDFSGKAGKRALEHEFHEKVGGRKEAVKCGRKLAGIGRFACRFRDPLPENQYNGVLECQFETD